MTGKEIRAARMSLPKPFIDVNLNPNPEYTDETRIKWEELFCRDMINSILCYDNECPINNKFLQDYIDKLGIEKVKTLITEQEKDFREAVVQKGIFSNTIVWADEYL